MQSLEKQARLTFSCLYSAYQYRNKFVHLGLPFPKPSPKQSTPRRLRDELPKPRGRDLLYQRGSLPAAAFRPEDLFDFHSVVADARRQPEFKDLYFKLLPTWHFLKRIAREAILSEFKKTAEA